MSTWWKWNVAVDTGRRRMVSGLALLAGAIAGTGVARAEDKQAQDKPLRFPGDPPEHLVVYQINKPEADYHDHIVFSVGAMLRQYGDNIKIAVVAFGPGIHVLLKNPRRPVTQTVREKIASLSDYGVDFYACGNTLKSLKLGDKDVVPFAKVVEVGASTLMELQKQGYAYISW
jgi:intracellular sulfur oxidation DsrE/DsrF family protein